MTHRGFKRPNCPSTETVLALAGEDACATRLRNYAGKEFRQPHPLLIAPEGGPLRFWTLQNACQWFMCYPTTRKITTPNTLMRTWIAILLTVGLIAACGLLGKAAGAQAYLCLIVGTSVWVGIDSFKIDLIKHKTGIAYQPEVLGILCAMFWFVCFPWYLSIRYKIKKGTAVVRSEFQPW